MTLYYDPEFEPVRLDDWAERDRAWEYQQHLDARERARLDRLWEHRPVPARVAAAEEHQEAA